MTNREKSIEIVKEMVALGYFLFGETPEQFVDRLGFGPEMFEKFKESFKKTKGIA